MMFSLEELTEAEIASRLALAYQENRDDARSRGDLPGLREYVAGEPRPASVLIPLLCQDDVWHLLFTRRNAALPEHSGQVAFPGGRSDPGDQTPEQTALREACEEIGLQPADVRVLGKLHAYLTITNYRVIPVVGAIPWPYPLVPAPEEVARIFTIPLGWLADPAHHEIHERQLPSPYEPAQVIYFEPYDGELLWGASARFTLALLHALRLG